MLKSKWTALGVGAVTYSVTTWLFLHPQKQYEAAVAAFKAERAAQVENLTGPSWAFVNPELSQLMADLRTERDAVHTRETQLNELELRLNAERQEIYSVTQNVYQLRTELEQTVTRVSQEEQSNLKRLAKVYADMSPEGAARILKEMQDDQVVKILATMKETESATMLEALGQGTKEDAKRAALISNRLRLTLLPNKTNTPAGP